MIHKKLTIAIFIVVIVGCKSQNGSHSHSHSNLDENHIHETKNYFESYTLEDVNYGTKTSVIVNKEERKMLTNALPDHKTGDFPRKGNPNTISAQNRTYIFPVNPKYKGHQLGLENRELL